MRLRLHHFFLIAGAKMLILSGVAACASFFIPYAGRFPYKELLTGFGVPSFVSMYANFDGLHYILIAQQGYSQYEQAFFPLYPSLMHALGVVTMKNYLLSGLIISYLGFVAGLYFFYQLMRRLVPKHAVFAIVVLLAFPTAFFFHSVYTEGLFFFLFWGCLYFFSKEKYAGAALFAFAAALTRLVGVFLIVPFIVAALELFIQKKQIEKKFLFWSIFPILGLLLYMGYLWKTTGDALFFFNAQPSFGANRSTSIILLPQVYFRYIKILLFSQFDVSYIVAAIELALFTIVGGLSAISFVASIKKWNAFLLSLSLISLMNLLLPSLTGTLSSIPRYALFSPSFIITLIHLREKKLKTGWIVASSIVQILLFVLFVQGYFVS